MNDQCIPTAGSWLREHTSLGPRQRNAMSSLCPVLIDNLPDSATRTSPVRISIGGAPGCGKSTLARMLVAVLADSGLRCQMVSLDDYYLPLTERRLVAKRVHQLCAVRGVPGTHDLTLLSDHLDRLARGDISDLAMPEFDKARDDRRLNTRRCESETPLDYIVLEGWICGAPPQPRRALAHPVNQMEVTKDPAEIWRQWVNLNLQEYHQLIDQGMDRRWYLRAPDWQSIVDWRWQQERELASPALKTQSDVEAFLAHYQRLVEHMQRTSVDWADLIIPLDASHCATIP